MPLRLCNRKRQTAVLPATGGPLDARVSATTEWRARRIRAETAERIRMVSHDLHSVALTLVPRPRRSISGRPSVTRSSAGAASCPSTAFTNGKRPQLASSRMRSHWPTAARWLWQACGRIGARRRANGCGPSLLSPPCLMSYARSFIIGCQWCWSPPRGRPGSERRGRTRANSKRYSRHTRRGR